MSYSVVQRTQEIGIRAAMGAGASDVVGLVLKRGMLMAALGLIIGLLGVFALTRLLTTLLFGVGARDPITIATVAGILAVVALLASVIPARRAAKVDPMICLRYE